MAGRPLRKARRNAGIHLIWRQSAPTVFFADIPSQWVDAVGIARVLVRRTDRGHQLFLVEPDEISGTAPSLWPGGGRLLQGRSDAEAMSEASFLLGRLADQARRQQAPRENPSWPGEEQMLALGDQIAAFYSGLPSAESMQRYPRAYSPAIIEGQKASVLWMQALSRFAHPAHQAQLTPTTARREIQELTQEAQRIVHLIQKGRAALHKDVDLVRANPGPLDDEDEIPQEVIVFLIVLCRQMGPPPPITKGPFAGSRDITGHVQQMADAAEEQFPHLDLDRDALEGAAQDALLQQGKKSR